MGLTKKMATIPLMMGSGKPSTTLADLFTLLFAANPFSAARASLWRWPRIETKFFFQLLVSLLANPSCLDGGR